MWNNKIELLHIKLGKTKEYEIISKIDRYNLTSFYDNFNAIDRDFKSKIHFYLVIHSCNRNLINIGTGKVRIYE